ncbi:aminopeptidase [Melampsora larici-populina 98AG31]|uniref:Peptide hydrolase n=1 Tax=Melampsora larici-populina (strain 98AG31 / pathotype 3-4-7) TaxID=747676 RepID=F4RN58_MELLP|nr:aminopeptidase [Melampsora larici-populina 98AG31]EGG06276.1 aminopeptidase [Melampsora larici-populina 98AG31]
MNLHFSKLQFLTIVVLKLTIHQVQTSILDTSIHQQISFGSETPNQQFIKFKTEKPLTRLPSFQQIITESQQRSNSNQFSSLSIEDYNSLSNHLESLNQPRLLRWSDGHQEWLTEGQKALVIWFEKGRRFVDVTDEVENSIRGFVGKDDQEDEILKNHPIEFPTEISWGKTHLKDMLKDIQVARMKSRLTQFTQFRTRYYRSSTGQKSQAWLLNLINEMVALSPSNVTVSEFKHSWGQNSIIARFEAHPESDETSLESCQTFVIGAHQDSTNLLPFLAAPGADDDGSGTTSILEAFSVLLSHAWSPKPNKGAVEFMWFSAEEGGLLGSQDITKAYYTQERNLSGMVQFDMTAFVKQGTVPNVGLVTDFVDPALTDYLRLIIDEYLEIGWVNTKCGYACSDHASFTKIGVPSAFAIESTFEDSNHRIHSTNDRFDFPEFSFEHMAEFSKLVIGLVVELAGKDVASHSK